VHRRCCAVFSVYRDLGFGLWPWAAGIGLGAIFTLFAVGRASKWMREYAKEIKDDMPTTSLQPDQVAILRVDGDGPTPAITGVRAAGILGELFWRFLSAPVYIVAEFLLDRINYDALKSPIGRYRDAVTERLLSIDRIKPILGDGAAGAGQTSINTFTGNPT